jgi:membrane protein DedA with SNARE-associated domain
MTLACLIGYFTGARVSGWARRFVGSEGLARAEGVARRYGDWAFVLCRPVPVLAEASVILAGLVKASFGRFLVLTTLANLGIALGYAAIGAYSMRLDSFLSAFIGAMLVPGLALLIARLFTGRKPAR